VRKIPQEVLKVKLFLNLIEENMTLNDNNYYKKDTENISSTKILQIFIFNFTFFSYYIRP
jgi:hypothetical protein